MVNYVNYEDVIGILGLLFGERYWSSVGFRVPGDNGYEHTLTAT